MNRRTILLLLCTVSISIAKAQQAKIIHVQTHTWISINSKFKIGKNWFLLGDVHVRGNNLFSSNSFYLGRIGAGYDFNKNLSLAAGYANLLSSPSGINLHTKADENRVYEQLQLSTTFHNLLVLQRLRNEQRWQSIIINDRRTGETRFTNRVRYLLSLSIPVFKNSRLPQLVFADEIMLQFGKSIVYNTFDQNRIFFGIKQAISRRFSFDAGYMRTLQQLSTGTDYLRNHTIRLFFYYHS